ncbi:MAG TPA: hypothetical protein PKW95_20430 [bacterium]|nr:hypothetical protein [bacterium]
MENYKKLRCLVVFVAFLVSLATSAAGAQDNSTPWMTFADFRVDYLHQVIRGGDLADQEDHSWRQTVSVFSRQENERMDLSMALYGTADAPLTMHDSTSPFYDLNDSPGVPNLKIFQGYAEMDGLFGHKIVGLRVGRQAFIADDIIMFDGARLFVHDPQKQWISAGAFAGNYVSFYELHNVTETPWGADVALHPFLPGAEIYGNVSSLFSRRWNAGWRQDAGKFVYLEAEYGAVADWPHHVRAQLSLYPPWTDFELTGVYYRETFDLDNAENLAEQRYQFDLRRRTVGQHNWDLENLLFAPTMPFEEFEGRAALSLFGRVATISATYLHHRLIDDAPEGWQAGDYTEVGGGLDLVNPWVNDLTANVAWSGAFEARDDADNNVDTQSVSAAAAKGFFAHKLVVSAGALWRTYTFFEETLAGTHLRADLEYAPVKPFRLAAGYSTDIDDYLDDLVGADRIDQTHLTMRMDF